jgi:hypothetical protein
LRVRKPLPGGLIPARRYLLRASWIIRIVTPACVVSW